MIHDILTTLRRRFPAISVLLYPVPVQGEGAAEKIAATIRLAGVRADCDALILARGGGSLEDLRAFNDEIVARAIYACSIPIVCGVGHETDFTIADFVADARAPTPTAAAEMLSPHQDEWLTVLTERERRLIRRMRDRLRGAQQHLDFLATRLVHPRQRLQAIAHRLGTLRQRLVFADQQRRARSAQRLVALRAHLLRYSPGARLRERRLQIAHLQRDLVRGMRHTLERARVRTARGAHALDTLSPLATLARGYAIVTDTTTGQVLHRARDTQPGRQVRARLGQGAIDCRIEKLHDDA